MKIDYEESLRYVAAKPHGTAGLKTVLDNPTGPQRSRQVKQETAARGTRTHEHKEKRSRLLVTHEPTPPQYPPVPMVGVINVKRPLRDVDVGALGKFRPALCFITWG